MVAVPTAAWFPPERTSLGFGPEKQKVIPPMSLFSFKPSSRAQSGYFPAGRMKAPTGLPGKKDRVDGWPRPVNSERSFARHAPLGLLSVSLARAGRSTFFVPSMGAAEGGRPVVDPISTDVHRPRWRSGSRHPYPAQALRF